MYLQLGPCCLLVGGQGRHVFPLPLVSSLLCHYELLLLCYCLYIEELDMLGSIDWVEVITASSNVQSVVILTHLVVLSIKYIYSYL